MASPFDFSRRSAFAQMPPYLLSKPKVSKAPQHNPYDKFTQDEFDAWIGGITGALKRALGQEDEEVSPPEASSQYLEQSHSSDEEEVERLVEFIGESSDEEAEASFSYPTARRVSKGKARDPRDGPGFGRGDQSEPILIDSDSGEDEEDEDDEADEDDEVIEGWDSQSEEDDEKRNMDWAEAESSVQARIRHEKQIVVEESEDDGENEEEDEEEDEEELEFERDEQQGDDGEDDYEVPSPRQTSSPVLVLDSDEEDEVHGLASQGRVPDETESAMERFDEDDTALPLSASIRVGTPRHRAKQQRHVSPMETTDIAAEHYEDFQPLENDTSFPPHEHVPPVNEDRSVELSDRWAGPETYAEDYYSGGDVRETPDLTADSLGMEHQEPQQVIVTEKPPPTQQRSVERHNEVSQVQDVIQLDVDEVDEVQPLSEDTSFPPTIAADSHFQSHQPIEILDPWVGPKTYAEDFYSGGDVRPSQNGILDPHRLGDNDESVTSTPIPPHKVVPAQEEVIHVDKIEQSEAQSPSNVDAAGTSSNGVYESPHLNYTIELPEPWDGPINYEEDYPVEVEVKSSPQMSENQCVGNDNDTPIIIDFEDETALVKPQDATAGTSDGAVKLAQKHSEESAERVLNHTEPLATSGPEDSSGQSGPDQSEDSNILDIALTGEPQHFIHKPNQDDMHVLNWINDPAVIHDMPTSNIADIGQSSFDTLSIEVGANEEAVGEIAEKPAGALETQLPTAEVSIEKMADAIKQVPNEDHSEAGLENTSEASEIGLPLPSASLGPAQIIEDARPVKHDQEPEINSLPTLAHNETEAGDRFEVDIDFVLKDDLVAPEIEEAEETDVKVDVGADKMSLDLVAVPEVHHTLTQDTIVKYIEVLDGDSATCADEAPKGSNLEISEPVAAVTADSDTSAVTETEPIVSRSGIPTMIDGLQSVGGDANTSDSQIAPASQNNSLQASADLTVHTCATSTSQPQSWEPTADSQSSFSITEPPQAEFDPAPDLAIMPSASQPSQPETTSKEQIISDSLTVQGPIPADSDMVPAPSDRQKVQLPSRLSLPPSALSPYPRPWVGSYPMNVVMRKASEPILFSDPYPASLSTPDDTDRVYTTNYKQILPQDFSSSSDVSEDSTVGRSAVNSRIQSQIPAADNVADNPTRDTHVQPNDEAPLLHDSIKVELASDADLILAEPGATVMSSSLTSKDPVAVNTVRDTHVQSNDEVPLLEHDDSKKLELANDADLTLAMPVDTALSSSPACKDFDKPLELNGPANSPGYESAAKENGDGNTAQQSSPLSSPVVECANGLSTTRVRSPPLEDDLPSILIIKKVHADDYTPVKPKVGRPQKRKRSSSVTMTSPLPKTGSLKKPDTNKAASRLPAKPRGSNRKASKIEKGKGKEVGVSPISQGSFDTRSISSRSSSDASAARRMLEPNSRGTSRASSIVSTAPSDNSISNTQPSPTSGKGSSFRHQPLPPPPPPVPLLHRHHHNRPQPSRPVLTQRASLSARQHDPVSAESSTSKQSTSSLHRHSTYSSSPVTRSNCRYHKISIPLDDESDEEGSGDEDVKLVYFLVPGCSLGNKELNRDEKIVDHGDAQPSDGLLMTSDLDAYAFNAPLLSVLRLLVGVDMLREGEIYYLPLPGSDWVPRKVRDTSAKTHQSSADHGLSHVTPRRNSNMSTSSMVNAPVSSNGSSSTLTPFRSMKPSSTISQTSSELTEVEDSPQSKRLRSSPAEGEVEPESGPHLRKSKHLGQDATEYRPNSQDEDNNLDAHAIGRARSNKGNKHGLKRSRTSDVIRESDVDDQKLKRQKTGADLRTT